MLQHSNFAAGRFMGINPKQQQSDQWNRLAATVSEHGPFKTADQLKKVRNLKFKNILKKC